MENAALLEIETAASVPKDEAETRRIEAYERTEFQYGMEVLGRR